MPCFTTANYSTWPSLNDHIQKTIHRLYAKIVKLITVSIQYLKMNLMIDEPIIVPVCCLLAVATFDLYEPSSFVVLSNVYGGIMSIYVFSFYENIQQFHVEV